MATVVCAAYDLPSQYFLGDVIDVFEDDQQFSDRITLPPAQGGKFFRVVITNATVAQVRQHMGRLMEDAVEGDPEFEAPDPSDRRVYRGKSRVMTDITQLPQAMQDDIDQLGIISGTVQELRQAVRAKKWDRQAGEPVDDGEALV